MACGLPAVATAVGGVPGAVGDCEGVVLVPPRNVDALARALDAVLSDGERRSRMGAASRARAEEAFGVTRNAGRILDYLGTVVERRRSSRASTGDSA
jgi:glycosyltransferase involved in cell wall biosynthesis